MYSLFYAGQTHSSEMVNLAPPPPPPTNTHTKTGTETERLRERMTTFKPKYLTSCCSELKIVN